MTTVIAGAIAIVTLAALAVLWIERRERSRQRTRAEDALKHLFEQQYRGRRGSFASLAGALRLDDRRLMLLLGRMEQQGLVHAAGQEFLLTPEGERVARQIVRAHRLLERYFADEARLPLRDIHSAAERQEHSLTPDQVDALSASLGHPRQDPHGDPIPDRDGMISPAGDTPVTAWPAEQFGRITHLEDEPPLAYAQILAEGLRIGQVVKIVEATAGRIVLTDGDAEFRLAPAVAANVFLAPSASPGGSGVIPLSDLAVGESAVVMSLDPSCQGFSRRRLMDLGFTPGARVESALQTFTHDPRGYRVRNTLVALRQDQARQVLVRPAPGDAAESAASTADTAPQAAEVRSGSDR